MRASQQTRAALHILRRVHLLQGGGSADDVDSSKPLQMVLGIVQVREWVWV